MEPTRVGIREFREKLSSYLESPSPVAITRHGATIGFYVPARQKPDQADLAALRAAGERVREMLVAASADEDTLVEEFKSTRRAGTPTKKG